MIKFIIIAFRNIFRHKRRTLFTVLTIVIGVAMLMTARGFINGVQKEMIQGISELMTGDIQIHTNEFADSLDMLPLDKVFEITSSIDESIKNIDGITAWTYRTRIAGIISRGEIATGELKFSDKELSEDAPDELSLKRISMAHLKKESKKKKKNKTVTSTQFIAVGIDPENELKVCPQLIDVMVKGGRFFTKEDNIIKNNFETVGIISHNLLEGLRLKLGDVVVLLPWDVNVKIIGTIKIDLPTFDKKIMYLPLKAVQNMLFERDYASNSNSSHEIVIKTRDINSKDKQLAMLQKVFPERDWAVQGWESFMGFFSDIRTFQDAIFWIITGIIMLIVSTGIINTSLMSVMERTREIGTLMSIGYRRKNIVTLFLLENLSIGVIGGIAGSLVGVTIVYIIHSIGLKFPVPGSTNMHFLIRPELTLSYILFAFGLALLTSIIAGIYPAYNASKMKPVDALSRN